MRLLLLLLACTEPLPEPPRKVTPSPSPSATPSPSPKTARLTDPRMEMLVIAEGPLQRPALLGELDEKWRREHDLVRIYGVRDGREVLLLDDGAETYDRVIVGIRLVTASGDDELRMAPAAYLAQLRDDVGSRLLEAGATSISVSSTPVDGAATSVKLQAVFTANSTEVQIRLLSPDTKPFPGPRVLALLAELKPDSGFEVKTKTPPGRLDRDALRAGKLNPTSLVFEMYVPHVAQPVQAFDRMRRAELEAEKMLGGRAEVMVETFGRQKKSDVAAARKRVQEVAQALAAAGFPAGSPAALRLFWLP
jgi:hypothetical protein